MSETIRQETVSHLEVAQASSGNVVISQESINEDNTSIVVEVEAIPALIDVLKDFITP